MTLVLIGHFAVAVLTRVCAVKTEEEGFDSRQSQDIFPYHRTSRLTQEPTQTLYPMDNEVYFSRGKAAGE